MWWKHILFCFSFQIFSFAVKSSAKSSIDCRVEKVPENQSHHNFFSSNLEIISTSSIVSSRIFGVWKKSWARGVNVNVVWIKAFFFSFCIVVANKQYDIHKCWWDGRSELTCSPESRRTSMGWRMNGVIAMKACIFHRDYKPYSYDQFLFVFFLTKTVLPTVYSIVKFQPFLTWWTIFHLKNICFAKDYTTKFLQYLFYNRAPC